MLQLVLWPPSQQWQSLIAIVVTAQLLREAHCQCMQHPCFPIKLATLATADAYIVGSCWHQSMATFCVSCAVWAGVGRLLCKTAIADWVNVVECGGTGTTVPWPSPSVNPAMAAPHAYNGTIDGKDEGRQVTWPLRGVVALLTYARRATSGTCRATECSRNVPDGFEADRHWLRVCCCRGT